MNTDASAVYSKENPFPARLTESTLLNGEGSAKETRHFVVDLKGSGLRYTAGDSLGVCPKNHPDKVEELLQALGWSGEEMVSLKEEEEPETTRAVFTHRLSLAGPTKATLKAFAEAITAPAEQEKINGLLEAESDIVKTYLAERELVDLVEEYPSASFSPEAFCQLPRKLVPRLYSIASSPSCFPDEIHLTVAVVRYTTNNRPRIGVASTFLADRSPLNEPVVPVYVAPSHFGLPEDPARDIIMVGPGTGIAPFRAFLQERQKEGGAGKNWLFFGDQHRATDYLYGEELEAFHEDGALAELDLAFSRDQEHKIYVQDRMLEKADKLWDWLENGASFYVCGDASRMAKDVEAALLTITREQGGMDEREAKNFLRQMRKEKRYQRDVY